SAADELSLTQSAVSQRIRKLEDRLEVPLFKRLPRGVELTVDGEGYLHHVQLALGVLSKSTHDMFDHHRSQRISIAATVSVATLWLAPRISLLARERPNIRVYLASVVRITDFDAIGADLEVRYGNGWPDRQGVRLYEDAMSPLCSPELLAAAPGGDWRQLPTISLIGPRLGWADWTSATNETLAGSLTHRFDTFITAMQAAIAGVGVMLGSLPLCGDAIGDGRLVWLSEREARTGEGYWLLWPKGRPPLTHLEPIVEIMTRVVP
ncbi:MAG: LysR substrate-binding domain-containing protein, partial [Proteobacteria bacterium]|nr:LysR substrate-binding domain-containing protein [Pseudomonadota bacterium]